MGPGRALFDLLLHGYEVGGKLHLTLEYNRNLFKDESVESYVEYFKGIVNIVIRDREVHLKDLEQSHDFSVTKKVKPQVEFSF